MDIYTDPDDPAGVSYLPHSMRSDNLLPMPANPKDREKHRAAGELMIENKARWLVYARAIEQMNAPESPGERLLNRFFTLVAIAGGIAALYFIAHQVAVWAQ